MLWRGRATVPRRCAHQEYASDSSRGFLIDAPARSLARIRVCASNQRRGFDQPDAFGKRHLFGRDVVMIFVFGLMNVFWVVEAPLRSPDYRRWLTRTDSFNLDRLGGTPPALGRVHVSSSVTALASRCSLLPSLPSRSSSLPSARRLSSDGYNINLGKRAWLGSFSVFEEVSVRAVARPVTNACWLGERAEETLSSGQDRFLAATTATRSSVGIPTLTE